MFKSRLYGNLLFTKNNYKMLWTFKERKCSTKDLKYF